MDDMNPNPFDNNVQSPVDKGPKKTLLWAVFGSCVILFLCCGLLLFQYYRIRQKLEFSTKQLETNKNNNSNLIGKLSSSVKQVLNEKFDQSSFVPNRVGFMQEQPFYVLNCVHSKGNVEIEDKNIWTTAIREKLSSTDTVISICKNTETDGYAVLFYNGSEDRKFPSSQLAIFDKNLNELSRMVVEKNPPYTLHNSLGYIEWWFRDDHLQIDSDDTTFLANVKTGESSVIEKGYFGSIDYGNEKWQYNLILTHY